jgi:hypothetical protein
MIPRLEEKGLDDVWGKVQVYGGWVGGGEQSGEAEEERGK